MIQLEHVNLHPQNLRALPLLAAIRQLFYSRPGVASHSQILSDINLKLEPGARLGLIGPNGAGKSSLLRLLAGIYFPTSGQVRRKGRTLTMFDLSFGMDDEANGYENLKIAGALLGLSRQKIQRLIPKIREFSELEDALHQPIKTYSAGMRMRLAFSLISNIEASNLLIDEIIGVGDASFLKKATQSMREKLNKTDILVIASHTDSVLTDFCTTGIVMDSGRIVYQNEIKNALSFYHKQMEKLRK